jgi:hypothetical protein
MVKSPDRWFKNALRFGSAVGFGVASIMVPSGLTSSTVVAEAAKKTPPPVAGNPRQPIRSIGENDLYELIDATGLSVIPDYPDDLYVDETQQIAGQAYEIVQQLGLNGVLKTVRIREGGASFSEGDGTFTIDVLQWRARKEGRYGVDGAKDLVAHEFCHEIDSARSDGMLLNRVSAQERNRLNQMRRSALDGYQQWADLTTDPNRAWNINRVFVGDTASIERARAELLCDMFGGTMDLTGGSWEYRGAPKTVRPSFRNYFDAAMHDARANK